MATGHDYSWFVLTQKIIEKEFALSGSEQNPDLTGKSVRAGARARAAAAPRRRCEAFKREGRRLRRRATTSRELVARMNALTGDAAARRRRSSSARSLARDREIDNPFTKDAQMTAIRGARTLPRRQADPRGDAAPPARPRSRAADRRAALDPDAQDAGRPADRPLRARAQGRRQPLPGNVFAAGEVAGFGGGGMHGYRALEGTFLGGCLFSGRTAGRAAAE